MALIAQETRAELARHLNARSVLSIVHIVGGNKSGLSVAYLLIV